LTIGVAGGALSADLAEQVRTRVSPNLHVFVASTECGGWGATKIDSAEDLQSHKIMPDREVQVVDDMGRPLPAGQIGEIRIGIIDGTTGYFRDEAASRIAFRDGYFYSGDLGFFRADGRLVLQGRMNDVLNIAGQKTAPEPVEEALKARLGVGEVCVIAVAARGADEEIHVVVEAEQDIADNRLIATWSALTRGAPPPRFHIVAALPRTETGKVQRSALRDQIRSGAL
jgi:acyl-coenzyme A synthetase/AMP-(fatty) acid ligase